MKTPTPQFTPLQLRLFEAYERVRSDGRYNMLDPRARQLAGLERDDFLFVLKNYDELRAQYEEKKK